MSGQREQCVQERLHVSGAKHLQDEKKARGMDGGRVAGLRPCGTWEAMGGV